MSSDAVMERSVIHAGKIFIKENEENTRAYLIQAGKVRSFKMVNENKIVIEEYHPGTIIGELGLLSEHFLVVRYYVFQVWRRYVGRQYELIYRLFELFYRNLGV